MSLVIKVAWRNILRNRKRTLITMASVFFAVFLSVATRSMQIGTWDRIIGNVVGYFSGYIQIQHPDYADEALLENSFVDHDALLEQISSVEGVDGVSRRIQSFALASNEDVSKGVLVVGVEPERENQVTGMNRHIQQGQWFHQNDKGIILATDLARKLNCELGDSVILISQGYRGVNAVGMYELKGTLKFASPELNKSLAFLTLDEARLFFGADSLNSALVIALQSLDDVKTSKKAILALSPPELRIRDWKEMMPELVQQVELDSAGNVVLNFILYTVIAFGILGTMIMMFAERKYELGVVISIGMTRMLVCQMLLFELLFLTLGGVIAASIVTFPILLYLRSNPIPLGESFAQIYEQFGFEPMIAFSISPVVFLEQLAFVLVIIALVSIYPVWAVYRLSLIEALRN